MNVFARSLILIRTQYRRSVHESRRAPVHLEYLFKELTLILVGRPANLPNPAKFLESDCYW